MKRLISIAMILLACGMQGAFAHAFLDEAMPKVGSAGNASPAELRLRYTQGIEAAFSTVTITSGDGVAVKTGSLSVDPTDNATLVVPVAGTLLPGLYRVAWAVVSVDTHHTDGTFEFTVGP